MGSPDRATSTRLLAAAGACFFTSGLAALLYEVIWMRRLGLVFGHTVHAVTVVLATYMAGLALGSWLGGRAAGRVGRPLRAYALLEAAIGLWCATTPLLFLATDALYLSLFRALQPGPLASGLVHLGLAALVLLPPTALMGATLPILSRAVVADARLSASRVGLLYALNTWGAVAGTAVTGFLLLPELGLRATVLIGVALNLAVAGAALLLERRLWPDRVPPGGTVGAPGVAGSPGPAEAPLPTEALGSAEARAAGTLGPEEVEPAARPGRLQLGVALAAIGASGAASMAYEIAWTRALALTLGSSTYAFTAMLTTFLTGLALGSLLAARWLRRRRAGLAAFGLVEAGVALLALALLPAFGRLPEALLLVLGSTGVSHAAALSAQFGLGFLVMISPTLLVGATFPLVLAAVSGRVDQVGRDVGRVYAANTLGTIAGSIVAGFLLIPAAGIQATVQVAAALNLATGLAAVLVAPEASPRLRRAATAGSVAAFLVLLLAAPRWDPRIMSAGVPVYAPQLLREGGPGLRAAQARKELLFYAEGLSTTVAVTRSATATSLTVNGKVDASTGIDMRTQLLLGHLGALQLEAPDRALVIGLASGVTAGAVAQHPFQAIDVAELEPAMTEASRFFLAENRGVLTDSRVRVLVGDGRQLLAAAPRPYDLIVSEPSNPWIAGVASLFTREFYQQARRQLSPRGVMVQWLQAYTIFDRDMRMVVRTFQEVFPHVTIWAGATGDLLLVATPGPACLDPTLVEGRLAASGGLREDFERAGWGAGDLAFRLALGEEDARRYAAGAPLNTDDLPLLEFSAPLALYASSHLENLAALRTFRAEDRPCVAGVAPEALRVPPARLRAARLHWREGRSEDAALELERLPPDLDPAARLARARLELLLGRFDQAWAEVEPLAGAAGADPGATAVAGALFLLGAPAQAERLARVMERLPGGWFARPGPLGELLVALGAQRGDAEILGLALEALDAAVGQQPGNAAAWNARAFALLQLGRPEEAAAARREAARLRPGSP